MDDTIWQSSSTDPAPFRFPPSGLPQHLFSHPFSSALSVFHPWWHCLPWLIFHSPKTKHESREGDDEGAIARDSAGREAHKQTDKRVWIRHSRLLVHAFFCPVHPLWRESWTSVYTVVCWNEEEQSAQTFLPANLSADWKLSKVTVPCKTRQHIHSKPEHKTDLFLFP